MEQDNYQNLYGLGDYNTEQIKTMAQVAELTAPGASSIIYDVRPDGALNPGQHIREIDLEEIHMILPDAFAGREGEQMVTNISIDQLEYIGMWGSPLLKQAVKDALERSIILSSQTQRLQELNNYIIASPAWQI